MPCSSAAPTCTALLTLVMGQLDWAQQHWPAAAAAPRLVQAALEQQTPLKGPCAILTELLVEQGAGCAVLAQQCCLWLWDRAADCPTCEAAQAAAALAEVLRVHPLDGCLVQCACAALSRLVGASSHAVLFRAAFRASLPTLMAVLCCPTLPPAATAQAAGCLIQALQLLFTTPALSQAQAFRMVELLQWHSLPEVQVCAVTLLGKLWQDGTLPDPALRTALCCEEVLQPLVRMLDSPLALARRRAVQLLASLGRGWPGGRGSALLAAGVLPPLLRALHPHAQADFVRSASQAIYCLLPPSPSEATARALLPCLAALLTAEEESMQHNAVRALCFLCSAGVEGNKQAVLEAGCLPHLMALLGQRSSSTLLLCITLSTLSCLALFDSLRLQAVFNAGAQPLTAALLLRRGRPSREGYHAAACTLLFTCLGSHSQVQAVLEAGCIQGLVRTARRGQPEAALMACWGLAQAGLHCSEQQALQLAGMGVVEQLCSCLARCSDGVGAPQGVEMLRLLRGLQAMMRKGVHWEMLMQEGGQEEMQRMALGGKGEVQEFARQLLGMKRARTLMQANS